MSSEVGKQTFEDAVRAFEKKRPTYAEYAEKLWALLSELLPQESINFHAIERRAKSADSLREKFARPGKSYQNGLDEITDLCGIRVITYSLDDVNRVCEMIQREFKPLPEHTVDKASILAPAEFGYRSRHFVVELGLSRTNLSEWKRFGGLLAEIQVRTVLEHAWAAMDHSLRYKREADVPGEQKRALFRLSALLEIADESFDALRKQQLVIKAAAQVQLGTPGDEPLELNSLTYSAYQDTSPTLRTILELAYAAGFSKPTEPDEAMRANLAANPSDLIALALEQGLTTINALNRVLQEEMSTAPSYFKDLKAAAPRKWNIEAAFAATLCLVRRYASIDAKQLTKYGFHMEIANRVVGVAQKHRTNPEA